MEGCWWVEWLYKMTTVPRALIYIRTLFPEHIHSSIDKQTRRDKCIEYCKNNGYEVYKIIEQKTSALIDENELYEIILEMDKGDYLVIYSLSHLARRQSDAHNLFELLRKKNCQLISLKEDINPGTRNEMFIGLYAWSIEQIEFSIDSLQGSDKILSIARSLPNSEIFMSQLSDMLFDK